MPVQNEFDARLRRITSRQNPVIKELRKAFAHAEPTSEGALAIEGVRMIEEAIRSGLRLHAVVFSDSGLKHAVRILPQISAHTQALVLPDEAFASAVSTEKPQGIAALVKLKSAQLEDVIQHGRNDLLLVGIAGLQDPGNLGTIIRSAEAFAVHGVLLGENTVSHFNAKAARASAGSLFREPLVRVKMAETLQLLKQSGVSVLATSSRKGTPLPEVNFSCPCMIVIGNEGAGVPAEILSAADGLITVPHSLRVESLNAGIATSIILYEAARQKQKSGDRRDRVIG
ncbi:MAG TPA: RNA methyltransferase [Candidatus Acidoferrales bacterium]|nr:RNA methyltransferase [Candidatus Acidoferrales bacterium]